MYLYGSFIPIYYDIQVSTVMHFKYFVSHLQLNSSFISIHNLLYSFFHYENQGSVFSFVNLRLHSLFFGLSSHISSL